MKRMMTRVTAMFLVAAMVLGSNPSVTYAFEDTDEVISENPESVIEEENEKTEDVLQPEGDEIPEDELQLEDDPEEAEYYGYNYVPGEENVESIAVFGDDSEDTLQDLFADSDIPSRYVPDLENDLPALKDQGNYETCWAFGALANAETSMKKQGLAVNPDYSELHLAYFTYFVENDPLGGISGDKNEPVYSEKDIEQGKTNFMMRGGNTNISANTLMEWVGAADESETPYSDAETVISDGLSQDLAFSDAAHLENFYTVNTSAEADRKGMKKLIRDLGGVTVSYYAYGEKSPEFSSVYSKKNNCYYVSEADGTNHTVAIVGWDDNFSRNKFATDPGKDGAWLVRNSWYDGEGSKESYDGYFWMSYEDAGLADSAAFGFEYTDSGYYDHNYQYDGCANTVSAYSVAGTAIKGANVFIVPGEAKAQTLQAVAFRTWNTNVDYVVDVYVNPQEAADPESGVLASTVKGKTTYTGYYTVPLEQKVSLKPGDKYSVVVTLIKEGEDKVYLPMEHSGQWSADKPWVRFTAAINEGESFHAFYTGSKTGEKYDFNPWIDNTAGIGGDTGFGNNKIKAFTTDGTDPETGKYYIRFHSNTEQDKIVRQIVNCGEDTQLDENTFSNSDHYFVNWNTKRDGRGQSYKDKATVKDLCPSYDTVDLYAQWKPIDYVTSIELKESDKIVRGKTLKLVPKFNDKDGFIPAKKKLVWRSSDESVATVSSAGVVTAKKGGTATINVTDEYDKDNPVKSNDCVISVLEPVTKITLPSTVVVYLDEPQTLKPDITPDDAYEKSVTWKSSSDRVATVDNSGLVTGVANGTAKITATATDGSKKSATCTVTVKTHVTGLTLDAGDGRVAVGKTLTVKPIFNDGDPAKIPSDKTLYWSSSDSSVATVSQKGVVTAKCVKKNDDEEKSAEEVTITAVSADGGKSAEATIKVFEPVTSLKLDRTSFSITSGHSFDLTATITPDDASRDDDLEFKGVKCAFSNENVLSVESITGNVIKLKAKDVTQKQTVKVTVSALSDSKKSATCTVTVGPASGTVSAITIKQAKNEHWVAKGSTLKLTASLEPANAQNKEVRWSSDDPATATVDKSGSVKGLKEGTVNITAKSIENPEKYDSYSVTVYVPVTKIALNATSLNLHVGNSFTFKPTVTPADATLAVPVTYEITSTDGDKYLEFDTDNPGLIKAKNTGEKDKQKVTVKVTAKYGEGGKFAKSATCNVTVMKDKVMVTQVKLSSSKISMGTNTKMSLLEKCSVVPAAADNKSVKWSSSNEEIVTVDANTGEVTALKAGSATITATAQDGSNKSTKCTVTVGNPVGSVAIKEPSSRKIAAGKTLTLKADVKGDGTAKAANTAVTWSIFNDENKDNATVNEKGVVTALKVGKVKITATAETPTTGEAKSDTIELEVCVPVSKISASATKVTASERDAGTNGWLIPKVAVIPSNSAYTSADCKVDWEIAAASKNDYRIANYTDYKAATEEQKEEMLKDTATTSYGQYLLLKPDTREGKRVKPGTVKLIARSADDPKKTVTINVKVIGSMHDEDVKLTIKSIPKGVTVKDGTLETKTVEITSMPVKKSVTLTPILTPAAADKTVTFRSSNPAVATVTSKGAVSTKNTGDVTITMMTSDGFCKAECKIHVQ